MAVGGSGEENRREKMKLEFDRERVAHCNTGVEVAPLSDAQLSAINRPIPAEGITRRHDGLSSIKPVYLVERLNEVFGCSGWQPLVIHAEPAQFGGKTTKAGYIVFAVLSAPHHGLAIETAGGHASQSGDPGDSLKGAMSDALSKACSYLGIGADVYKGKHDANSHSEADDRKFKLALTQLSLLSDPADIEALMPKVEKALESKAMQARFRGAAQSKLQQLQREKEENE